MASRLTDSSDSSSDEETANKYNSNKRNFDYSFDDSSYEQSSKRSRSDSSYNETYYNKDVEEEDKEDKTFEAHNVTNFYDKTDSDRSINESDEVLSSYYHDSSTSDHNSSISHPKSNNILKLNKISTNLKNVQTKDKSTSGGSSMAERYMQKHGHKAGLGIGKNLQGISDPIAASTQKGRRGFGFSLADLEQAHIEFKPEEEIVEVKEEILWLENKYKDLPSYEEINSWKSERSVGERKETIDGETKFCDEIIVKGVIKSKSVFDRLDKNEMREARTRSNPFETIRGSIFLNRAAVKMANIDRACDFIFTQPEKLNGLLYFADVCAGPGGFSEYVLWKKKWHAKGFGFTLKGDNDFKLHDFHAGPCETFHPFYGTKDDGDVYDPENQISFRDLIMNQTERKGVHFMMADGGFSVEGQENIQEILSKQLYLCQCLVALMIVRPGGHFVTKLFDLFTPFSAGLVYIMYRCFEKISIFKPNTSRPANSERYIICERKHSNLDNIVDYLFETNKILCKNNKMKDILELVPTDILTSDTDFYEYLKNSNEMLGQKQIIGLKKIAAYTEDKNLFELRQKEMREQCLQYWGLPDEARKIPRQTDASSKAKLILGGSISILEKNAYKDAVKLNKENLSSAILINVNDWLCTPCFSGEDDSSIAVDKTATFFLSMGRSQVYKYEKGYWEQIKDFKVALPRDTLVYAEAVMEMKKEGRSMTKTYGFHILDAFSLGSENISHEYFYDRLQSTRLFCEALWKPADSVYARVRLKEWLPIDPDLHEKIQLEQKTMKNGSRVLGYYPRQYHYENDSDELYYYVPRSIVFFKFVQDPWSFHFSNKMKKMYFFNKKNKESYWEVPETAKASFTRVIQNRIIWIWPNKQSLTMDDFLLEIQNAHKKK